MKNLQNQTTILLVENNSDWLLEVYSVFQEAGYNVLIATGGDEGFCVARRKLPDLILSETALPDISGVELCYMVRADKALRAIPFVLMGEANSQDGEIAFEGFRAGADDYFEENFNPQFLEAKVARLIKLQRSEAELRLRYQNLHYSESYLAKIIEETSDLVTVLDPTLGYVAFDEYRAAKSKTFFDINIESGENTDALETWEQALQVEEFAGANKFGNKRLEKVYYEIVC